MFKKLTGASVALVQRFLPHSFIFAILLTIISFAFSLLITGQSIFQVVSHWGNGVWSLLSFTMQMTLVLVLGNALAISIPIKKVLKFGAKIPKSPTQSIMLVTLVSSLASWINWGFGLIVAVLFAKEIAKVVRGVDYRLLVASAYSGFCVWHGGLSGSIPLQVASDINNLSTFSLGTVTELIPVTRTIFSPFNLILSAIIIITLPLLNRAMLPVAEKRIIVDPSLFYELKEIPKPIKNTFATKLENSKFLSYFIVALFAIYLVRHFITNGLDLNLNIVNSLFLMLGILFHKTPIRYVQAINEAIKVAGGILLQYPLYAGIMGIMTGANADGISLASVTTNFFINISTDRTFPLFSYLSAGFLNIFIPSGGGQWAVQAPIMMPASAELGIDPAKTAMAISWGDAWTNMIQPFWALPTLAIANLNAKDIMGYCLIVLFFVGIISSIAFLLI